MDPSGTAEPRPPHRHPGGMGGPFEAPHLKSMDPPGTAEPRPPRRPRVHDLIIDNALIVDGTGAPAVPGSVAVSDGRITAVGLPPGAAARERLDAEGRVLAPGFIDPHTHYDAQLAWDPLVTPSSWHGVTTVVTGNCGVGVAPC